MARTTRNPIDVFWSKVAKTDHCWTWEGSRHPQGYGTLSVGRKTVRAHRFSYELANGPFDASLDVCHHCDNPSCVRPDHLFLGTARDNMRDASRKGRVPGRPRPLHCPRGHLMVAGQYYVTGKNRHICKTCVLERNRRFWRSGYGDRYNATRRRARSGEADD
jgi:HNH endonuclease